MAFPRPILTAVGQALYGERWQAPLARDLGVTSRTMRRWVAGDGTVPDGVRADLIPLITQRKESLLALQMDIAFAGWTELD